MSFLEGWLLYLVLAALVLAFIPSDKAGVRR